MRIAAGTFIAVLFTGVPATPWAASPLAGAPDPARQGQILYLLRHDCGSCHGMTLAGGLGPALRPERLAPMNTEALAATILQGRPGTPMPPWNPFLSEMEARWLAQQLQQGIVP
jgi:cytochrome c55X